MAINFTCVRCDRKYSVADAMAGRRVTCKACGQEFNVPGGTVAARSAAFDDDDDDDDDDDGPPISMAPPPRTVSPAAYMPPRADPPPRAVSRPGAVSRPRSAGTPDWVPSAIKGVLALAAIAGAGGAVWYVVNHGVPSVADIQNIGVSDKARDAVALVKEYIDVCNEMADNLAKMHDPESARGQATTMQALDIRVREVQRKLSVLKTLSSADEKHLKATVGADIRQALGRVKSEVQRITSLPAAGNPSRLLQSIVGLDREIAHWGDREGSLTGNTVAVTGGKTVTVEATGLDDEAARNAFGEKLRQLAGASGVMTNGLGGGGARYQFEISSDAEAFSKRIIFANVTKVSGDKITVVASPLTAEDLAAEREKIAARKADDVRSKEDQERRRRITEDNQKEADARRLAEVVANTPPPLARKVNPSAGPIDKALADTRAPDRNVAQEALRRLAWGIPEERKAEVAQAVAPLLQMKDMWTVSEAVKTLAALKAPEGVSGLLAVVGREDISRDVMKALGEIGDARAATALADRLEKGWPVAQEALIAIGPAAEAAVLEKLRDPRSRTRTIACEVLEKIGGKETLKLMLTLPADSDGFVRMSATTTMKKIVERVGPIPEMKASPKASPFKKVR